jgi:ABC-type antimicrobial peptide transport system permease subunit
MIIRNLLRRKTRTLLTIFGIAVGVAAVVALGALAEGFLEGYGAIAGGSGADLLVVQDEALDIVFSAVDQRIRDRLEELPGVERVTGMIYTFAATEDTPYFILYGYDPQGFAIDHFKIVEGQSLSDLSSHSEVAHGGKPLILGHAAAEDFDKQIGDTFYLYESAYRVVGIYETGEPFEDGAAVIRLEDAQAVSGKPQQVNAFLLKLRAGADIDQLRQRIERRFEELTATKSADFVQEQDMLQFVYVFSWSVSLIAVVIGGVGVMNTVLMSVFERTREFGVLRALGWRPLRILLMVLSESLLISLIAGALGTLLGVAGVRAVGNVPGVSGFLPGEIPSSTLAQGLAVAIFLGLVGGAFPAWKASQLVPAEAMRSEGGSTHASRNVLARAAKPSTALRNVLRQPTRTILTVVGIGIALMAIVLLGAMGDGLVESVGGMAGGLGAQLVGMEAGGSIDLSKIDEGVVQRIGTMPGVRAAEGFLTGYTSVGDLPFFVVFGYRPRGLAIREYRIVEGQPLTTNRQMIMGRVAAENLNMEVGDAMRLFDRAFRIVGIYETGVSFQDGGGVVTLRDAQRLFGQPNKVSFLGIWLEERTQAEAVIRQVEARFPEVDVSKASAFTESVSDLEAVEGMTWGISLMALVVGGLGMMNTMVMSVFERTREIGVLRALGWRRLHVLWMILRESVTLTLVGGVAGSLVGVLIGLLLNTLPFIQGMMRVRYTVGLFAQALVTALGLGVVGGVYPAWWASNLQPVEALRYE